MAKPTQGQLLEIFDAIRALMQPYEKGTMHVEADLQDKYDLWSHKELVDLQGKARKGMPFATILIKNGYVGFYFTVIYMTTRVQEHITPELLKCLKGKACFHITANDPTLMKQIKAALKLGYDEYKKLGWVS